MGQGFASQLAIGAGSGPTTGFEFNSCGVAKTVQHIDATGIRGTRSHMAARTRKGNESIGGPIDMSPSPEELAALLPWILGAVASGNTYALAETLPSRYVTVDKTEKVMAYDGCMVNKATFSASEGTEMKLALEVVGKTETPANAGSLTGVTYQGTEPLLFTDSVLTILSVARSVKEWSLTIDNQLAVEFYNSTTATRIVPQDRLITFNASVPYFGNTDLYDIAIAGDPTTLVLTAGGYVLTFAFAALQYPQQALTVQGKTELMLPLQGTARATISGGTITRELITTLDSTP
jgi:hypothetical protein